jgi:hypothetical protein
MQTLHVRLVVAHDLRHLLPVLAVVLAHRLAQTLVLSEDGEKPTSMCHRPNGCIQDTVMMEGSDCKHIGLEISCKGIDDKVNGPLQDSSRLASSMACANH